MKILILKQNITDQDTLTKGIALAVQWCQTIGLNLEFWFKDTSKKFSSMPVSNNLITNGFMINPTEIFQEAKASNIPFDVECLVYDWTKISPQPTNPTDGGMNIQIPIQWYTTFPEVFATFLLHEICHYYFSASNRPDITHLLNDGNLQKQYPDLYLKYKQLQPKDYYLYLLSTLKPMPTYKYFKPSEIVGLKDSLVSMLDKARGIAGIPFKITSGLRTPQNNAQSGGVQDSSHLTGNAVDLACSDSQSRLKIVSALLNVGFTRIGIYLDHIHCDNSPTLPSNVMWVLDKE